MRTWGAFLYWGRGGGGSGFRVSGGWRGELGGRQRQAAQRRGRPHLDAEHALAQQHVAHARVEVHVHRVARRHHVAVLELHRLGARGAQLAADDDLAALGAALHHKAQHAVARAARRRGRGEGAVVRRGRRKGGCGLSLLGATGTAPPVPSEAVLAAQRVSSQSQTQALLCAQARPQARAPLTGARRGRRAACSAATRPARSRTARGWRPSRRRARRSPAGS